MSEGMLRSVRENATLFAEKKLEELYSNSQTRKAYVATFMHRNLTKLTMSMSVTGLLRT